MLFPTIDFLVFFVIVFTFTWSLNQRNGAKKLFLVLASYYFYAQWDWRFIFLLAASSIGNFAAAWLLSLCKDPRASRVVVSIAVCANLAPLGYFKYYDFLSAEAHNLLLLAHLNIDFGSANVALPVAISFLTFHGISYIVDVHRGRVEASRSLIDVMLYMAFFPHLVAGPIVRAADFLRQLSRPGDPADIRLGPSLLLIVGGLFKKVVIAGHLSTLLVDPVFADPASYSRVDLLAGMIGYAVVIFCDFSAYTDIATGVANLLGYHFPPNFNQPYRALSLQDFWRRWHMTLSSWLRDYLYIPLGGSRGGTLATYRNLMLTMLLGGLWHGAGPQFILWGAMHGVGLAVERMVGLTDRPTPGANVAILVARWALTFAFVDIAWVFFRAPSLSVALDYFGAIGGSNVAGSTLNMFSLGLIALGMAIHFIPRDFIDRLGALFGGMHVAPQSLAVAVGVWATALLSPPGVPPFIYFQF